MTQPFGNIADAWSAGQGFQDPTQPAQQPGMGGMPPQQPGMPGQQPANMQLNPQQQRMKIANMLAQQAMGMGQGTPGGWAGAAHAAAQLGTAMFAKQAQQQALQQGMLSRAPQALPQAATAGTPPMMGLGQDPAPSM